MYKTIAEIRAANRRNESCFFDKAAMKFFGSRIESGIYGGRYFVTSEDDLRRVNRFYTVREAKPNGEIVTVGQFQGFKTKEAARNHAKWLASEILGGNYAQDNL